MKLVTFEEGGARRTGALVTGADGARVVDLTRVDAAIPADMVALLAGGAPMLDRARAAVANAPAAAQLDPAAVKLKAPVPRPGKIICIGLNYHDHAAESNQPVPEFPTVFCKYANVVIGPGDMGQAHQTDEWCRLDRIDEARAIYADVIEATCLT